MRRRNRLRASLPGRPNVYDMGVTYVVGGATLTEVPYIPGTGQYTFDPDTGVYGFAHVEMGKEVAISVAVWNGRLYVTGTKVQVIP